MISYEDIQQNLAGMKAERQSYDSHYRELESYANPRRGRWLETSEKSRGHKRNQNLIDTTMRLAVRTAAAGIHAGSTNPSMPWFKLTTADNEMNEESGVSMWLYAVEQRMRDVFERSNVYSVLPMLYGDGITFGTAPMTVLEHPQKIIHCVPAPIGSYYLATNYYGDVATKYCEYKMTAAQMVSQFGFDKCSQQVQQASKTDKQAYFDVLHVIEENEGRDPENYSNQHMAYRSVYVERGVEKNFLRFSGFEENPLACLRWETTEITDPYGSSPGMDALGLAKAAQLQQKRKAQAIDKHIDPPMVGDPALQGQPSSLIPGDVTWHGFTANGSAPKFQPAYIIKPELQGLLADIEDIRNQIHQTMYTDLFLAITLADPRNASAAEIYERREEKILMLGPMLKNHENGLIKPLIERTFYIMLRRGLLPPPPPQLANVDLKVEMVGLLAQSLKAVASSGIERFGNYVAQMAKVQADSGEAPTALDKFDVDQSIDEYGLAIGVPPTVIRPDEQVAALREQRAQAAQQQQAQQGIAAMESMSKSAKNMSETKVGDGNMLEAVAG